MDELELIRSFREEDAVPDANARAAARERLLAHKAAAERTRKQPARRRRARWRALYRRLRREVGTRSGPSVDEAVFTAIANLLSATPAPDRLRAALYRALAGVHGSHLLGPARDDIGRPGVAVAFDESWWRTTLIFDPATSELLGTRATVTRVPRPGPGRSTAPVGTTLASTTYLQTGVVRSTRDRP